MNHSTNSQALQRPLGQGLQRATSQWLGRIAVYGTLCLLPACASEDPSKDAVVEDDLAESDSDALADVEDGSDGVVLDTVDGDAEETTDGVDDDGIPASSWPYCSDEGRGVLPERVGDTCYEPIRCHWDWEWCVDVYDDWTSADDVVCVRSCACSGLDTSNEFSTGTVVCSIDDWGSVGSP